MLKHGILGLLNYQEMTGYEIMQTFRDSLNFFWKAQTSQIYRELTGLEKQGWVGKTEVVQEGKPNKKIYAITPAGKEELLRWLGEGGLEMGGRSPTLMKTFFLGERSREENRATFAAFKAECEQYLEGLKSAEGYVRAYGDWLGEEEKSRYWAMTVELGRRQLCGYIEWAQWCMEQLEGEK